MLKMKSLTDLAVVCWTGEPADPRLVLQRRQEGRRDGPWLAGHTAIVLNQALTRAYICDTVGRFDVAEYRLHAEDLGWERTRCLGNSNTARAGNDDDIVMLSLSSDERWCIATTLRGFRLWRLHEQEERPGTREQCFLARGGKTKPVCKSLALPPAVRNVPKKFGLSSSLILSAGDR
jgi:hypothetical protein